MVKERKNKKLFTFEVPIFVPHWGHTTMTYRQKQELVLNILQFTSLHSSPRDAHDSQDEEQEQQPQE